MPVKEKTKVHKGVKYEATLITSSGGTYKYKPSCNKPDRVEFTSSTLTKVSSTAQPDWIESCNRILYTNSKRRKFNRCAHVNSLSQGGPTVIEFLNHQVVDWVENPNMWKHYSCATDDYVEQHSFSDKRLRLKAAHFLGMASSADSSGYDDFISSDLVYAKLDELARVAIEDMTPKLDDGFSVPVFIVDIIECRKLWESAKTFWDVITDVIYESIGGATFKDVSKTHLAYQFGLKPMFKDIIKLIEKFRYVNYKVLDFLENQDKLMTYRFERRLSGTDLRDPSFFLPTQHNVVFSRTVSSDPWYFAKDIVPAGLTLKGKKRTEINGLEYHATMCFKYKLPDYGRAMQAFLASLDHYGVNLSPSDIWEVIPFSFLVDWVFDVGSWLEKFDFENLPVTLEIVDFCDSIKYVRTDRYDVEECLPLPWQSLDTSFSRTKDCFYRWPGIPLGGFGGPKMQDMLKPNNNRNFEFRLLILASLAHGRVRYDF